MSSIRGWLGEHSG